MIRSGAGRPPHKPTGKDEGIIRALVLSGHSQEAIGKIVRLSVKTLVKHYGDILENEKPKALATVAANLFRQATKDDFRSVGAAAFIMKTQAGWKENSEVALTDPDGEVADAKSSLLAKLAKMNERLQLTHGPVIEGDAVDVTPDEPKTVN